VSRIVYVNGEYVDEVDAKISIFDRGFLFADGVYEVSTVINGRLIDNDIHLNRLQRSLSEIQLVIPNSLSQIEVIQQQLIDRNQLVEGIVYLQVTRGAADRDFKFPDNPVPSLVMFTQQKNVLSNPVADKGIHVMSVDDIRWARRDIKTVGLLAPSMAKQKALDEGADDAWMVEDGFVTEGSSSNAFIVTQEGTIVTRNLGNAILAGITRSVVLSLATDKGIEVEERPFSITEAYNAAEAFSTSASSFVYPVVKIDGTWIADGKPGAVALELRRLYIEAATAED
jgi:D-alanine transaminase